MRNTMLRPGFLLPWLIFILVILAGCNPFQPAGEDNNNNRPEVPAPTENPAAEDNRQLAGLLPDKEGYTWYYNGFAEYGHRMTLNELNKADDTYTYSIEGEVDDPSGGEAPDRDYSLQITYTITGGGLTQVKREFMMLDSEYDRLELIKTPLEKGTRWNQQVADRDNNQAVLECTIEDVRETGGAKIYHVTYRQQDSDYYEKREIKEGVGVIAFEKLLVLQDQSFPAGYSLNEEASGYKN